MAGTGVIPFDRSALTGAASLNKLVLLDGPYRGRSGADLLSRDAVAALAPELDPRHLSDGLATRPDLLLTVGQEVGRRVAALIVALRRGPHDPAVPDRTPERIRALEEWIDIDDIVLGGGLVGGPVGDVVLAEARSHLASAPGTRLTASPHAPWLGLIGAARSCAEGASLVIDGGQTSIKPAIATVEDGELRCLRLLPRRPFDGADDVASVFERVLSGHGRWVVPDEPVPCSIAAYVRDGRPTGEGGNAYERLADAPPSLLERLLLLHDGSAAWRGTGRTSSSAVIVLGTWLGVGMGPHGRNGQDLRPLGADFHVAGASASGTVWPSSNPI